MVSSDQNSPHIPISHSGAPGRIWNGRQEFGATARVYDLPMMVRSATQEDIPAMLQLWRQFWTTQPYEANLPMKIEKEPDLVLVAEDGGKIVGSVIGGFDLWWAWIYRVAVDRECQKKGVGASLLKAIQVSFKARGIDSADLIVSPENQPMLALLKKFGCREHSDRRYGMRFS